MIDASEGRRNYMRGINNMRRAAPGFVELDLRIVV
jgi:hypothetical protein